MIANKKIQSSDSFIIFNLILMIIGVIGNSLCIKIYSKKEMRKNKFNWYLLVLAIFELIFCFILFANYLFQIVHPKKYFLYELNNFLGILMGFLIRTIDSYLVLITLYLSIDRLYAIKHPIEIKDFITNLHVKYFISITFACLIPLEIVDIAICYLIDRKIFYITYCGAVSPIIFRFTPALMVLIVNSLLLKELFIYYSSKCYDFASKINYYVKRTSLRKLSNKVEIVFGSFNVKPLNINQKSHYICIICLSLWAVITTIPYYVLISLTSIIQTFEGENEPLLEIQNIVSILFNSNHVVNFFLYFSFHSNFRSCIYKIFSLKRG